MPLVEVDLDRTLYNEKHEEISAELHQAQIDALDIPVNDLFQVFRPHDAGELKFDRTYGGVDRQNLVVIHVTMVHKYSVASKRRLYKSVVDRLEAIGVRPQDIQIAIIENGFED